MFRHENIPPRGSLLSLILRPGGIGSNHSFTPLAFEFRMPGLPPSFLVLYHAVPSLLDHVHRTNGFSSHLLLPSDIFERRRDVCRRRSLQETWNTPRAPVLLSKSRTTHYICHFHHCLHEKTTTFLSMFHTLFIHFHRSQRWFCSERTSLRRLSVASC